MELGSSVEVRAATPSDRGALQRLLVADLVERGEAEGRASLAVERAVEIALSAAGAAWLLVAVSGGMPVGVLLANPAVATTSGGALLRVEALYVAPSRRRRGVGGALVRYVAAEARNNGMGSVELELDPAAPTAQAARALLAALGASLVERQRFSLRS